MIVLPFLLLLAPSPTIELAGTPPAVEVRGLDPLPTEPAKVLTVVVATGTQAEIQARTPLLGEYTIKAGVLRFEPRFPFEPGVSYLIRLHSADRTVTKTFEIPRPKTEAAVVQAIYPSPDRLPDNTLRFYVQFSKPMTRGDVYRVISLRNDTDRKLVELPFLELGEELWSPDRTRLTLLIDPGRIKREVKPRVDLGPALQAGKKYSLIIEKGLQDEDGNAVEKTFVKSFSAIEADRRPIQPENWKLTSTDRGPSGKPEIQVMFDRPMDRGMAVRSIRVVGPDKKPIEIETEVLPGEQGVRLISSAPRWLPGRHELVIRTWFEDMCGNRVHRPFEVDLSTLPKEEQPTFSRFLEIR